MKKQNAYIGKFVDRYPRLHAAGILTKEEGNTIEKCLKIQERSSIYFFERDKNYVCEEKNQPVVCIKGGKQDHQTELSKILKANDKSPFQNLANELRESVYASYWKSPLGERQHPPKEPSGFNPEILTHGVNTEPKISAGEIINPRKSHEQVLNESEIGKELYKLSHDEYDPGEQVRREYDTCCNGFDPSTRFGGSLPQFHDGRKTRRVLKWVYDDPISYVTVRQADFDEKNKPRMGKARPFTHCQGITASEPSKFGICLKTDLNVSQLLGGSSTCSAKQEQMVILKYINSLRIILKKRNFPFEEFINSLKNHNQECNGQLPMATVDSVCTINNIFINKPIIKLLKILGIMNEKKYVDIVKFVNLLNWKCCFPDLPKIDESKDRILDYGLKLSSMTGENIDTSGIPPAGKPSVPLNSAYPQTRREVRADKGNLEGETDAYAVVSPSIFTTYGLSHRDFFKPRRCGELEKIFKEIGVDLPQSVFNNLWNEGLHLDNTGGVCVETFRNLLQKCAANNLLNT